MSSIPSLALPLVLAVALALGGCGGGGGSGGSGESTPPPPSVLSLVAPMPATVQEAENPTVPITVSLDSPSSSGITVSLEFSGSATRDFDYTVSDDSIEVMPNTTSASVEIDVFRDFDVEGDETITVSLGTIEGNAETGTTTSVSVTLADGGSVVVDKAIKDAEADVVVIPTHYHVTDAFVDFGVVVWNFSNVGVAASRLFAEWSSDKDFAGDVNSLGIVDIPAFEPDVFAFPDTHRFSLPLNQLAPNQSYFIRAYLSEIPEETSFWRQIDNSFEAGFALTAEGKVRTSCEAPIRAADPGGSDPLFAHQWHLRNTAQGGLARNPGVAGSDLQMAAALDNGRNGDGARLAVVDTGLEICHPDLAANVEPGKSYSFSSGNRAGSSATDPFNHDILGDHGTSVAGVAAAVANNGLGGRGVASEVALRGFTLDFSLNFDLEAGMLKSLGGSSSQPDSASAHIFNMSYGTTLPPANSEEYFVRLVKMGTRELRSGLGGLYVKAAGNEFGVCVNEHPLNSEIGCIGSNTDPDQNLPYLVTVGAFNANDVKASYSSAGANLWVVAPGGEDGVENPAIITTDQIGVDAGYHNLGLTPLTDDHPLNPDGDYMDAFAGTSASAPAASGAIAILLGVNPNLTWRDVKHILAATARTIDPDIARVRAAFNGQPYIAQHAWQTNAAGYTFHNWYGFGAIAVDAAVAMATDYTPNSLGELVESPWFGSADETGMGTDIPDADGAGITDTLEVTGLPDSANIEAVVLEITVNHTYGSDLGIKLTSPGGMESIVNTPFNEALDGWPGMHQWHLMSNAFYGENPNGRWTVQVADLASDDTGQLGSWRLRFYYGEHP